MSHHRELIEAAVEATEILSPTTFAWFGRANPPLPRRVLRSMTPRTAQDYLRYGLQSQLYANFYCQGFPMPAQDEESSSFPRGTTPFLRALSSGNVGTGCRESGWEVRAVEENAVLAHKDGLDVWAWTAQCVVPPGADLEPGTQIALCLPKDFLNMMPGFYMALGDLELPLGDSDIVVRFYWHLTPDCAATFVRSATTRLNEGCLPFRLKVLRDPSLYTRCDAGVVYTLRRDYTSVSQILAEVYGEVSAQLNPRIPAFTKLLAPGLGLAEDPGAGQSFGEHRCYLLADALISAHASGLRSVSERVQAVADHFERDGLSLVAPFLGAGSRDEYVFEIAG